MPLSRLRPLRHLAWLWLAWLLIGNVALNTGLASTLINRKPEAFRMQWRHGLTLWPGQAWLWQASARGHVRRVVWTVEAERAHGRIALLPLLVRQLRIPSLHAAGAQVTLLEVEHDRAPVPARPGGWWIRLDKVHSDSVREVRFDGLHLAGHGRARTALRKQLRGGPLEILPSSGAMTEASLRLDGNALVDDLELEASFALAAHRRDRAAGLARLAMADTRLRLEGRTVGVAVAMADDGRLRTRLDRSDGAERGRISIDLAMRDGALVAGSVLNGEIPLLASDAEGGAWSDTGEVRLRVDDDIELAILLPPPPGDVGHVRADLTIAGRALPFSCQPPPAEAPELGPACVFDDRLRPQASRVDGEVALFWHFDSLDWVDPLLARIPWLHLDGAGTFDAQIRIQQGEIAAGSQVQVPMLATAIDVLDNRFEGQAQARVWVDDADDGGQARAEIVLDRFRMHPVQAPSEVYVQGRGLRLDLSASDAFDPESVSARLRFSQAQVPDLAVYNRYLEDGSIRFLGGVGVLTGDLHLDVLGEVGQGRFDLRATPARLEVADMELEADVAIDIRLQRADLEQRRFRLDGSTLNLDRVRALDDERLAGEDWWLHARFDHGRIDWSHPLRLEAQVDARARNAALVLGLFATRRQYPRWVLRMLDDGDARLTTAIRMRDRRITLDPLRAWNDRFDVQARLDIGQRTPSGRMLLSWGRLKAGLELANGERNWHLRRATEWFEGREDAEP